MRGKIFTTDEANRMLPLVSRIADDIVASYARVHAALQAFETVKARGADLPETEQPDHEIRLTALDDEVARQLDAFQALIEEVEALGGTVKDYERGCIDFYGDVDGEIVYLCWQRGEDAIAHWHKLDEGYAKRQAIAVTSAA